MDKKEHKGSLDAKIMNTFDSSQHFLPELNWEVIKKLDKADFLWEIMEPMVNMVESKKFELKRLRFLSPHQKALYFFWYLDAQVTNGGFLQFYWNGYYYYWINIYYGLLLCDYKDALVLFHKANDIYLENEELFEKYKKKDDYQGLAEALPEFDELSDSYYALDNYGFFENFVRKNKEQFFVFKKDKSRLYRIGIAVLVSIGIRILIKCFA